MEGRTRLFFLLLVLIDVVMKAVNVDREPLLGLERAIAGGAFKLGIQSPWFIRNRSNSNSNGGDYSAVLMLRILMPREPSLTLESLGALCAKEFPSLGLRGLFQLVYDF